MDSLSQKQKNQIIFFLKTLVIHKLITFYRILVFKKCGYRMNKFILERTFLSLMVHIFPPGTKKCYHSDYAGQLQTLLIIRIAHQVFIFKLINNCFQTETKHYTIYHNKQSIFVYSFIYRVYLLIFLFFWATWQKTTTGDELPEERGQF